MRSAPAADLLELWESAARCEPHQRAVRLLAFALPDQAWDALADLDLGLRDWHLLRLRRALFGPVLAGYADCPHCGERLEMELDAHDLQSDTPLPPAPQYIGRDGCRFRLPNSRDLIAIADVGDVEAAARQLFVRCAVEDEPVDRCGTKDSTPIDGSALQGGRFEEVEQGLAKLAAERSLQFDLACAVCGKRWPLSFDPGMFLWDEIEARAVELLDDVHRIASAYGWSESEILALSDARRTAYLSRVN